MPTIEDRFKIRRGTAADLASVNEVPLKGEFVWETDQGLVDGKYKLKIGDGVTHYNDLAYLQLGGGVETIVPGDGVDVDSTDPKNPVVSSTLGSISPDGRVSNYASLPSSGLSSGNTYYVESDGLFYIWNGSAWPAEGDGVAVGVSVFPSSDGQLQYVTALVNFDGKRPISACDLVGTALIQHTLTTAGLCTITTDGLLVPAASSGGLYTGGGTATTFFGYDFPIGLTGTIDVWVKPSGTGQGNILTNRPTGAGTSGWLLRQESGGKIIIADIAGASATTSSAVLSTGVWAFLRIRYLATTCELWVNGTNVASFTRTTYGSAGNSLTIGYGIGTSPASFPGTIASYRITQGYARPGVEVPATHFF